SIMRLASWKPRIESVAEHSTAGRGRCGATKQVIARSNATTKPGADTSGTAVTFRHRQIVGALIGLSFGPFSRNVDVQSVAAIGQCPVQEGTDVIRDRLHRAVANQELTGGTMGPAELPNAPLVPISVVCVLDWQPGCIGRCRRG